MPKMGQCVIFFLFQLKAEQLLFGRMDNFPKVNSRQKLLNRLKKVDWVNLQLIYHNICKGKKK